MTTFFPERPEETTPGDDVFLGRPEVTPSGVVPPPSVSPQGADVETVASGELIDAAWGLSVANDLAELWEEVAIRVPGPPGEDGKDTIVLQPEPPADLTILWGDTDEVGDGTYPGPAGPPGPQGTPGVPGPAGPAGAGVPAGGTTGQQIVKSGATTVWQSKPVIDVRDYPIVGDGVADDTAALAAAVLAAYGGTLLIPQGLTLLTDKVVIAASQNKPIVLTGGGKLRLRTVGSALIEANNLTNQLTIRDLILDGNNIALTNAGCGVIRILGTSTTQATKVLDCEIFNANLNAVVCTTGARVIATGNHIHDCAGVGVYIQTPKHSLVEGNYIHDVGQNGISIRPSISPTVLVRAEGIVVSNNIIFNIRDDLDDNGPYGNGITLWYISGVTMTGNAFYNTAFSFIRGNHSAHLTITGNTGSLCLDDSGIQLEFGCHETTCSNNTLDNMAENGIALTNIEDGAVGLVCNGNAIRNFSQQGGVNAHSGIVLQNGMAVGNYIDGANMERAIWGIRIGTPSTVSSYEYRCLVEGNQFAGTKFGVGLGLSSTTGTKEAWITGNQITRRDANYSGPIGAVGGSNSDQGGANVIVAASASSYYFAENNFDIPTAQTPFPFMTGTRIKINGVWMRSTGTAWLPVDGEWHRWTGTQAAYDAIAVKDPDTLYVVI